MLNTARATHAIAVAPHHLASQSALAVLRDGGNAIEAMVAAAATIAIVYPHMNGIGGDSFWVIVPPHGAPIAIDACGPAAHGASVEAYHQRGLKAIPVRGPLAANTVAGTIGGWQEACTLAAELGGTMPLARLLNDAIGYCKDGVPVTLSQQKATAAKFAELEAQPGFREQFLVDGKLPQAGQRFVQSRLASTLSMLVRDGLDSYYRGPLSQLIAADLQVVGSLVSAADLAAFHAQRAVPLHLVHSQGDVYNTTPPTQGAVSLAILGLLDRVGLSAVEADSADHVHLVVEATKRAFTLRDQYITDPAHMTVVPQSLLQPASLDALAADIRLD